MTSLYAVSLHMMKVKADVCRYMCILHLGSGVVDCYGSDVIEIDNLFCGHIQIMLS